MFRRVLALWVLVGLSFGALAAPLQQLPKPGSLTGLYFLKADCSNPKALPEQWYLNNGHPWKECVTGNVDYSSARSMLLVQRGERVCGYWMSDFYKQYEGRVFGQINKQRILSLSLEHTSFGNRVDETQLRVSGTDLVGVEGWMQGDRLVRRASKLIDARFPRHCHPNTVAAITASWPPEIETTESEEVERLRVSAQAFPGIGSTDLSMEGSGWHSSAFAWFTDPKPATLRSRPPAKTILVTNKTKPFIWGDNRSSPLDLRHRFLNVVNRSNKPWELTSLRQLGGCHSLWHGREERTRIAAFGYQGRKRIEPGETLQTISCVLNAGNGWALHPVGYCDKPEAANAKRICDD